jgi:hypothetical protein
MGRLAMDLGIRLAEAQREWARCVLAELSE